MKRIAYFFVIIFSFMASGMAQAPAQQQPVPNNQELPDETYGSEKAPIEVIMFYSVDCGHCKVFRQKDLPVIIERFIKPGWVRFIIKDFPIHPNSLKALQLARCGGGKCYEKVIDTLFEHQEDLFFKFDKQMGMEKDLEGKLIKIGQNHGLSMPECQACLHNQALADAILSKRLAAQIQYNIDFTPAFIVNGKLLKEEEEQVSIEYLDKIVKDFQSKGVYPSR